MPDTEAGKIKIAVLESQMQEVKHEVECLQLTVKDEFGKLSDKLDKTYLRKDVYELDKRKILKAVESNTGDKKWVVQIIIQVVLTAIIAGILKFA